MLYVTLTVTLTVVGPVLTRASAGGPLGVDAVAARTPAGRLCLPFSLVKGRLRQAWKEIGTALSPAIDAAELDRLLGAKSTNGDRPSRGRLRFSDFECAETDVGDGRLHRIKIDPDRGAAIEGALQVIERPIGVDERVAFTGRIEFLAPDGTEAERVRRQVEMGLRWIPSFGGERAVGFGRLADVAVELQKPELALGVASPETKGPEAAFWDLVVTATESFCVARRSPSHNVFESDTILSGAVLKGAIASAVNAASGRDPGAALDHTLAGPLSTLARNFDRLRFTHAFPATGGTRVRPVVLPLSLVKDGNGDWCDVALVEQPKLIGKPPRAPVFAVDWKDDSDVRKSFGWLEPARELRVRTAIDWGRRRAMDEQLFAYDMVVPAGLEWLAHLDLTGVPAAERAAVVGQLGQVLDSVPVRIGKTKARTEIAIRPDKTLCPKWPSGVEPIDGRWLVCLQSPALLTDPSRLDEGSGEADLRAAYEAAWNELHGGRLTLERFFASQSLRGGYLVHRFQPGRPYNPFLLTDAGSVFVFVPAESAAAADVESIMRRWLDHGLPLPRWAKERYGDSWQTCPFRREEGFGEVAVNLPCHRRLPEATHDV